MTLAKSILISVLAILANSALFAGAEYHVSVQGDNANPGSPAKPFRTIQFAADLAQPGDTITVHEGVYRERINPPRGGTSEEQRIVYQAAPGADVAIKASEIIKGWKKIENDTWTTTLSNDFFKGHNPYEIKIAGDWFTPRPKKSGRVYHTGTVYLNGHWLKEAAKKEDVLQSAGDEALWFGEVNEERTTLYAQFKDLDPNRETVEINAREAVFYPEKPGINYITVRGFTMEHAAPNWAPPTAEQVGLIGTHWSKGWIIEDNTIRYSICTGITLGKHGDEYDNTSADSAEGYVETIKRALARGWSKEKIGSHIVRNNHISHCEQAGIVGSMGAAFSKITGNVIHDINMRQMLGGAEMAGIKFHAPIDSLIEDNHIYRCAGLGGIWLDWMTQGTRVTGNLMHDNQRADLFSEVNHGPYLVDNNIFLSPVFIRDHSTGGAFVHNLIAGAIEIHPQGRETPYHPAHSTEIAGLHKTPGGDNRYLNNTFMQGQNLEGYSDYENMTIAGNALSNAEAKLVHKDDGIYLEFKSDPVITLENNREIVTSQALGTTVITGLPFKQSDGTDFTIDKDYFGKTRSSDTPAAGPFEAVSQDELSLKVWPKE
jgi:alpha-N-arabinofuranosidase